jgi:hypothetical protein
MRRFGLGLAVSILCTVLACSKDSTAPKGPDPRLFAYEGTWHIVAVDSQPLPYVLGATWPNITIDSGVMRLGQATMVTGGPEPGRYSQGYANLYLYDHTVQPDGLYERIYGFYQVDELRLQDGQATTALSIYYQPNPYVTGNAIIEPVADASADTLYVTRSWNFPDGIRGLTATLTYAKDK